MNIFNRVIVQKKISVNMNDMNLSENIQDILYLKLKELENKCNEVGYVKEDNFNIEKYSYGFLNPTIFVPFIEYTVLCSMDIFTPSVGDIYSANILSINQIGIMCSISYRNKYNKIFHPIKIIISKHTQSTDLINNLRKGDQIDIKLLAFKFNKNSTHIDAIADIITKDDINYVKTNKIIIDDLKDIEHNCKVSFDILNNYRNILKVILDREVMTYNELFIYHFIKEKNVSYIDQYVDIFKDYILHFNDSTKIIKKKVKTVDLNPIDLESETNFETETNNDDINLDLEDEVFETMNDEDASLDESIEDDDLDNDIDKDDGLDQDTEKEDSLSVLMDKK